MASGKMILTGCRPEARRDLCHAHLPRNMLLVQWQSYLHPKHNKPINALDTTMGAKECYRQNRALSVHLEHITKLEDHKTSTDYSPVARNKIHEFSRHLLALSEPYAGARSAPWPIYRPRRDKYSTCCNCHFPNRCFLAESSDRNK